MSKIKEIALMYAVAGALAQGVYDPLGGGGSKPNLTDDGKRFSGGKQTMREFVINGVSIMATDKKMARKKYNSRHKK